MSTPASTTPAATERRSTLEVYRDDGPLATALGAALGRAVPLPATLLIAAGLVPLLVAIAVEGDGASDGLAAAALGWFALLAGLSSGRPHTDRLRWAVPSLLRAGEYAGILWIASLAGSSSLPAAFALLCAVAFRQYDLVYRLRYRGTTPPAWVGLVALGWEGRLVLGWVLLVAGALPAGFFVLAGVLAVVFVGESVSGWTHFGRAQRPALYEEEEGEAE
jgi:hypothetical protein